MNNIFRKSIPAITLFWSVCFFFVLAFFYLGDIQNYIFVERDLMRFFIPPRQFWVEEVKNLTFPLWNPYYFNGHPLFATLQPGVLYPFSALYLFMPFHWAFNLNIEIHFALSGWFTYLLLRGMNATQGASLISGIGFMLSGYLLSIHSFLSTFLSVTWVPLFFLVFFAAIKKNHIGHAFLAGVVGTFMFLGGGVEVCYFTFSVTFILVLLPELILEKETLPNLKRRLFLFALFCLVFFGLSAVQLIPFLELSQQSIRSKGLEYWEAGTWSLHLYDLVEFFIPNQYGLATDHKTFWIFQNMLKTIYVGTIPFLLSLFLLKENKRRFLGFLFLFMACMAFAMGKNTSLYYYLYEYLPFFNKLRYPVKFIFMAILILCIVAGLGYDSFKRETNRQNNKTLPQLFLVLGFLGMVGFGTLILFNTQFITYLNSLGWGPPKYNEIAVNLFNIKRLFVFASLFCLCIYLYFQPLFRKPFLLVCIISIFVLDLFFSNYGYYKKESLVRINKPSENSQFIQSDPTLFRIYTNFKIGKKSNFPSGHNWDELSANKEMLQFGTMVSSSIFHSQGNEVMRQARWENINTLFDSAPLSESANLLGLMNVKYIISKHDLPSPNFKQIHSAYPPLIRKNQDEEKPETVNIYENKNVFPRAFLVPRCKVLTKDEEYSTAFKSKQFDPNSVVLLDKNPKSFDCEKQKIIDSKGTVEIEAYNSNSVYLMVVSNSRQFLFMSDSFYPGWKAYVDGEEKEIFRANYQFRAVLIEPGEHTLRFEYDPFSFKLGLAITLLTILVSLIYFFRAYVVQPSKIDINLPA